MHTHETYMQRCIELALKGAGYAAPNPMVGAVLVYNDRIIGEGWHRQYGAAHAEVNCINSVVADDVKHIPLSTLYVSLEPCAHFGKTPPCADLIIKHKIPKVVVGCIDTFTKVSGKGIERLKAAGVALITDVLREACIGLNKRFFTRQEKGRPYIILKWAESSDGYIAPEQGQRVMLSNSFSQTLVHKMRSEEDAILVGFTTALLDNPSLNNRYGTGKQPLRIVIDPKLQLPQNLNIFDGSQQSLVLNYEKDEVAGKITYAKLASGIALATAVLAQLPSSVNSVIIEGGSKTLKHFIDAALWDEAVVFSTDKILLSGTPAPKLKNYRIVNNFNLAEDRVTIYTHENP